MFNLKSAYLIVKHILDISDGWNPILPEGKMISADC